MTLLPRSRVVLVSTLPAAFAFMLGAQACGDASDASVAAGSGGQSTGGDGGAQTGGSSGLGPGGSLFVDSGSFGTGGWGTGGAAGNCGGDSVTATPVKVELLLVVDRSESMTTTPSGFTSPKWGNLISALSSSLDGIRGKMSLGMQLFPDPPAGSADELCGMPQGSEVAIPIGDSDVTVPLIKQKLEQAQPAGSTPAADALELAHTYFTTGGGQGLEGKRYVLLALDGGPNCNAALDCSGDSDSARSQCTQTTDKPASCSGTGPIKNCCDGNAKGCLDAARVIDAVTTLRTSGVVTLVVGIPGSEAYATVLDELAEQGGAQASSSSPKYFRVTDPAGLTATLRSLTLDLVRSCELALESSPPDRNLVNVFLDGTVVPQEGDDGWELDPSTNPPTIRLKGETCRGIEANGAESISVEFGCPTIRVPA